MSSRNFIRRELPLLLVVVTAFPIILNRFVDDPMLLNYWTTLGSWTSYISMIAWGLGVIYLFNGEYHSMQMNRSKGIVPVIMFGILVVFSLLLVGMSIMYANWSTMQLGITHPSYVWWYNGFYGAQSQAFYGLMFLYLMSASYRMLRFRNLEASILLLSGIIYTLRNTSIFNLYFPWMMPLGEWINNIGYTGGYNAALICMAFGSLLIGCRQLLGRERTAVEVTA